MIKIEQSYLDVIRSVNRMAQDQNRPAPRLIAVSKKQPVEAIERLYWQGQKDFGENYVQELLQKAKAFEEKGIRDIRWHFIGNLQANKVKALVDRVSVVHSVASLRLAEEIARRWRQSDRAGKVPIFIQVNLDKEASKGGVQPQDLRPLSRAVFELPEVELCGLMCIPDPDTSRDGRAFRRMKELAISLGDLTQGRLSMGMSQDYDVAIAEGATDLRLGTVIFGERQ